MSSLWVYLCRSSPLVNLRVLQNTQVPVWRDSVKHICLGGYHWRQNIHIWYPTTSWVGMWISQGATSTETQSNNVQRRQSYQWTIPKKIHSIYCTGMSANRRCAEVCRKAKARCGRGVEHMTRWWPMQGYWFPVPTPPGHEKLNVRDIHTCVILKSAYYILWDGDTSPST